MSEVKVVEANVETFPAGLYYVGDLCYLLPDHVYDDYVCSSTGYEGVEVEVTDGEKAPYLSFYSHTAYGDGLYRDNNKNSYCVDAGIIGIVQLVDEEMIESAKTQEKAKLAKVIKFEHPFTVDVDGGTFEFGDIKICTE